MLEPLKQWICDTCGGVIESAKEGWIEWLEDGDTIWFNSAHGFKIVHHSQDCFTYPERLGPSDMNLSHYAGEKGYIHLLSFLDLGRYIMKDEDYKGPRVKSMREFVEILRRLTLPYYEEARLYFDQARADDELDIANVDYIYYPEELKRLIGLYGRY